MLLIIIAVSFIPVSVVSAIDQQPVPKECLTATNFTQSWRLDHKGSDIRPGGPDANRIGWACEVRKDLQWFRFSGEGGT